MNPSEQDIFDEALAIDNLVERASYLTRACQGDHRLKRRVETLLAAYFASDYLEAPAEAISELARERREGSLAGAMVASYAVLELIGEGGMGDVYRARHTVTGHRYVALKVIKPGMDSRQVIARFELERTALARMDHPHIAQFIEAGVTDQGRAFFAMELVRGLPITSYCDRQRLLVTQRLKLMTDVCLAVQHAHSKGLVHRDLKPSNILVTEVDGEPVVKVIDFGVAKALDQELSDRTIFTAASQLIGTPPYMSPEQVRWCPNVNIRSDVYSLGVLLYELLSGAPPFDQQTLNQVGFAEFCRLVQEEEPPAPSVRIVSLPARVQSELAAARGVSVKQLRLQVRGELDWIALLALAKDPEQRYANPGDLAEDLNRFLTHRIVRARAPSLATRARKWTRRHRRIYWSAVSLILVAAVVAAVAQVRRTIEHARAAVQQARDFEYARDIRAAHATALVGDTSQALALLHKHQPPRNRPDEVGFEWHYLTSMQPNDVQVWAGHSSRILAADVSPNGKWIASGDGGGEVRIWNPTTGQSIQSLRRGDEEVTTVKFSADGKWLATSGVDRVIRIWETGSWQEVRQLLKHENTVCAVAWSPDGERLGSGGRDGDVYIWEATTGRHLQTLRNNVDVVRCIAWSPDSRHLASGNGHVGGVNLWDTTNWKLKNTYQGAGQGANMIAFSQDGRCLAFGGYGGILAVVNLDSLEPEVLREMVGQIWSLVFIPGDRIAVGISDGAVEVVQWHRDRRNLEPQWFSRLAGMATHRAILPLDNGRHVVLASQQDNALKLVRGAALFGSHVELLPGTPLGFVAGNLLYVDDESRIVVRDGLFGESKKALGGTAWQRSCPAAYSPVTGRVAIFESFESGKRKVCLFDSADWTAQAAFRPASPPVQMSFSRDGRYLVGGGEDGSSWCYDLVADERKGMLGPSLLPAAFAFSPTEDLLVQGACGERRLQLWKVPEFKEVAMVETQSTIKSLTFHPDGRRVAVGEESAISIRDIDGLRSLQVLHVRAGGVTAVAYSPNGRTLASSASDGIHLWDAGTGQEFFTIGTVWKGPPPTWLQFVNGTTLLAGNGKTQCVYQYGELLEAGAGEASQTLQRPRPTREPARLSQR